MRRRRDVLLGTATVGIASMAGCAGLGSIDTLSWEEAFQQHLTDEDVSVLDPTPVAVNSVTTETEIKTALAVLGWTKGGLDVSTETISQMDRFATTTAELQDAISPTLDRLNRVVDLIDEMKNTSALGISVWDALVTAKPPVEGFDTAAREAQTQLESISSRLHDIEEATEDMSRRVGEIQSQRSTDYGSLPRTVESAITVAEDLMADTQDAIDQIIEVEDLATEATDAASELPAMNRQVSSTFGSLNSEIAAVRQRFEGVRGEIESLQSALDDLQNGASNQANERFELISRDATGSAQQMSVADIDTSVEAYQRD